MFRFLENWFRITCSRQICPENCRIAQTNSLNFLCLPIQSERADILLPPTGQLGRPDFPESGPLPIIMVGLRGYSPSWKISLPLQSEISGRPGLVARHLPISMVKPVDNSSAKLPPQPPSRTPRDPRRPGGDRSLDRRTLAPDAIAQTRRPPHTERPSSASAEWTNCEAPSAPLRSA